MAHRCPFVGMLWKSCTCATPKARAIGWGAVNLPSSLLTGVMQLKLVLSSLLCTRRYRDPARDTKVLLQLPVSFLCSSSISLNAPSSASPRHPPSIKCHRLWLLLRPRRHCRTFKVALAVINKLAQRRAPRSHHSLHMKEDPSSYRHHSEMYY